MTQSFPTTAHETLIIHHLSDLHHDKSASGHRALDAYEQYVQSLPTDKRPHLLIVTGDLTVSGTHDELQDTCNTLQRSFAALTSGLRQRIFVVPGPHDLDWINTTTAANSFDTFRDIFKSFCLPLFIGRDGTMLPGPEPYAQSLSEQYLVYLINTTWTPEAMPRQVPRHLEELTKRYRDLWRDRAKVLARPGGAYDVGARQQFLQAAESVDFSDAGVVHNAEIDRFTSIAASMHLDDPSQASYPGGQDNQLRIIVSHHPLIAHVGRSGQQYPAAANAGLLLRNIRRFGFTIALHGHYHEPHVVSDYPIDSYSANESPLWQIGGGSLGDSGRSSMGTFNEIVAVREPATGLWTIDTAAIDIENHAGRQPLRFALVPPRGGISQVHTVRSDANQTAIRAEFEYRLRFAMRLLTEGIEDDSSDLPIRPLATVKEIILHTIFSGIETRVGLAIKQRPQTDGLVILQNRYIDPDIQVDEQYLHPYTYGDTVAAWALILGETIVYPFTDPDKLVNFETLENNNKLATVTRALREMIRLGKDSPRAASLLAKLDARTLRLGDLFAPSPKAEVPSRFTSFVSIPVPLRATGSLRQRELAVLNVDVHDVDVNAKGSAFTEERIDMLRSVSAFIDLVLSTADKLRRPRGTWHLI